MARKGKTKKDLGSVLAEANAAPVKEKPKRKRRKASEGWPCTAEQITQERDVNGYSWRQVAANLGLENPGQARKAYTELTGRHHSESNPVTNRAPKGSMTRGGRKVHNPKWNDDSDQDEIIEMLTDATITVERSPYGCKIIEDVQVYRVDRLYYEGKDEDGPLAVCLTQQPPDGDGDARKGARGYPVRSFRVADIVAVR